MDYRIWAPGGDQAENGFDLDMLPQTEVDKNINLQPDRVKALVGHSLVTSFNPDQKLCGVDGQQKGEPEQGTNINECPIVTGSVIGMMAIPRFSSLKGFWWRLRSPAPGVVVSFGIRGCAKSLLAPPMANPNFDPEQPEGPTNMPTLASPVPEKNALTIPLLQNFDAGQGFDADGALLEDCYYPNGFVPVTPDMYFDQNDMLNMRFDNVPEDADVTCLDLEFAPVIDYYCKGGAGNSKANLLDVGPQPPVRTV